MTWFLIVLLAIVLLALLAVVARGAFQSNETEAERAQIEMDVRRAERRLHQIARDSFLAMLEEARANDGQ